MLRSNRGKTAWGQRSSAVVLTFALACRMQPAIGAVPVGQADASGQIPPGTSGAALDRVVSRLLGRMTLEEKILQLLANPPNGVPRLGIPDLRWGEGLALAPLVIAFVLLGVYARPLVTSVDAGFASLLAPPAAAMPALPVLPPGAQR